MCLLTTSTTFHYAHLWHSLFAEWPCSSFFFLCGMRRHPTINWLSPKTWAWPGSLESGCAGSATAIVCSVFSFFSFWFSFDWNFDWTFGDRNSRLFDHCTVTLRGKAHNNRCRSAWELQPSVGRWISVKWFMQAKAVLKTLDSNASILSSAIHSFEWLQNKNFDLRVNYN